MIMSFGKYKGDEIESLPEDYLRWIVENIEDDEINHKAVEILEERRDIFPGW